MNTSEYEKWIIVANILEQQDLRTVDCDGFEDCLHPNHVSEEKQGPNSMDGSCKGETNRVNVKHTLLNDEDVTLVAFIMAHLN